VEFASVQKPAEKPNAEAFCRLTARTNVRPTKRPNYDGLPDASIKSLCKSVSIREIRAIRGPSVGPHSGGPRTTRLQANSDSLKLRSHATSRPVRFEILHVS
jgi:hypothetical protein